MISIETSKPFIPDGAKQKKKNKKSKGKSVPEMKKSQSVSVDSTSNPSNLVKSSESGTIKLGEEVDEKQENTAKI